MKRNNINSKYCETSSISFLFLYLVVPVVLLSIATLLAYNTVVMLLWTFISCLSYTKNRILTADNNKSVCLIK